MTGAGYVTEQETDEDIVGLDDPKFADAIADPLGSLGPSAVTLPIAAPQ